MNLWQRLEKRGREEFRLDEEWIMYHADLIDDFEAQIDFAKKDKEGQFLSHISVGGIVKWADLRD